MASQPGRQDRSPQYCIDQVRALDRDRYLTALFAPAGGRSALFAVYAFNIEIARICELVREPTVGLMRLQWWREAVAEVYAGSERRHQVLQPLSDAVRRHRLSRHLIDGLIDAHEADLTGQPPADLPALVGYADHTAGNVCRLAMESLAGPEAVSAAAGSAARHTGIAWSLTGLVRSFPFHARAGRIYLPKAAIERSGLRLADLLGRHPPAALSGVVKEVADAAREHLGEARRAAAGLDRRFLAAVLSNELARIYLDRLERAGYDVSDPRVQQAPAARIWRLGLAWLRGRV
jgi:phytoene synthase